MSDAKGCVEFRVSSSTLLSKRSFPSTLDFGSDACPGGPQEVENMGMSSMDPCFFYAGRYRSLMYFARDRTPSYLFLCIMP